MIKLRITNHSSKLKRAIVNIDIDINRLIVRFTPKSVLKHFREGTYETNLSKEHPTIGYMPWKKTQKWLLRALACDCGYYSSQELNTSPLGEIFLEIYDSLKKY